VAGACRLCYAPMIVRFSGAGVGVVGNRSDRDTERNGTGSNNNAYGRIDDARGAAGAGRSGTRHSVRVPRHHRKITQYK